MGDKYGVLVGRDVGKGCLAGDYGVEEDEGFGGLGLNIFRIMVVFSI